MDDVGANAIFKFLDVERRSSLSERWTPWGGGRRWEEADVAGDISIFLGSGGGEDVFLAEGAVAEDLWSWRWSVVLSGGTFWWRSPGHRWPSSNLNGSLP